MVFTPSIQTYAGSGTPQSSVSMYALPDWGRGVIWIFNTVKFSKSQILGGAEVTGATWASYSGTLPPHCSLGFEGCALDPDGNIHVTSGTGFSEIDGTTLVFSNTWGSYGGIFPPGLPYSTSLNALGGSMCVITNNSDIFTVGAGIGGIFGAFNECYVARLPDFAGLHFGWTTPSPGALCFSTGPGSGLGYLTEGPTTKAQTTIHQLDCTSGGIWIPADWPATNPNTTETTLATFVPTDLDAAWTEISIQGICLDQSDDNLLVFFTGQPGATNPNYLAKVDSSTGAILWQTIVPGNSYPSQDMGNSDVNGTFALIVHSPKQVMVFDTSDGSVTTTVTTGLSGLIAYGKQCFSRTLGAIVLLCNYTGGADSPTPLGGSTTPFTGYATLYVIETPTAFVPSKTRIWGNWP